MIWPSPPAIPPLSTSEGGGPVACSTTRANRSLAPWARTSTEVIFTSGATESDALGVMAAARGMRGRDGERDLIVVSGLEHDAVAHQREVASREGFSWEVLPVDAGGRSVLPSGSGDGLPAACDSRSRSAP